MGLEQYEYFRTDNGVLYCGDCLDIMPLLPKVDLVLTDPPYEISAKGCGLAGNRKYLADITTAKIETGFDVSILDMFKNWFCFCSLKQMPKIIEKAQCRNWMLITWGKTNPTPLTNSNYLPDAEYIIHSFEPGRLFGKYKDKSRYIISPVTKNTLAHPTVKPLHLIDKCLTLGSQYGDTILDLYLGSGTTAVACERLHRKWIGIEISEAYCEIAQKRIKRETQQLKMF